MDDFDSKKLHDSKLPITYTFTTLQGSTMPDEMMKLGTDPHTGEQLMRPPVYLDPTITEYNITFPLGKLITAIDEFERDVFPHHTTHDYTSVIHYLIAEGYPLRDWPEHFRGLPNITQFKISDSSKLTLDGLVNHEHPYHAKIPTNSATHKDLGVFAMDLFFAHPESYDIKLLKKRLRKKFRSSTINEILEEPEDQL